MGRAGTLVKSALPGRLGNAPVTETGKAALLDDEMEPVVGLRHDLVHIAHFPVIGFVESHVPDLRDTEVLRSRRGKGAGLLRCGPRSR